VSWTAVIVNYVLLCCLFQENKSYGSKKPFAFILWCTRSCVGHNNSASGVATFDLFNNLTVFVSSAALSLSACGRPSYRLLPCSYEPSGGAPSHADPGDTILKKAARTQLLLPPFALVRTEHHANCYTGLSWAQLKTEIFHIPILDAPSKSTSRGKKHSCTFSLHLYSFCLINYCLKTSFLLLKRLLTIFGKNHKWYQSTCLTVLFLFEEQRDTAGTCLHPATQNCIRSKFNPPPN
jgi:hypothetical protein